MSDKIIADNADIIIFQACESLELARTIFIKDGHFNFARVIKG